MSEQGESTSTDYPAAIGSFTEAVRALGKATRERDEARAERDRARNLAAHLEAELPEVAPTDLRRFWTPNPCRAASDGECGWALCPQLRDGEPQRTDRHCPRDNRDDS